MPLAKTPESRARLLAVIEHDVKRLDRLISDVSDASRLDAELQRQDVAPVDLTRLLNTVVTVANEVRRDDGVKITLAFEGGAPEAFVVPGHDSRLGQVIDNLIENARSFSPQGGTVRITARRLRNAVEITVDDDGPGIQPEAMERIFERFYTDRPHQGFGQNSGLGLSISRQIVEAHGGRIRAENRMGVSRPSRTDRRCSARASWCACRRCDGASVARCYRTIHASAVLVGARAVLIRGAAGSRQVELAFALIRAGEHGALPFTRLVGDDRVHVEAAHGRLLVRPAADACGPDRDPRARHPPPAVRTGRGRRPRRRPRRGRRGAPSGAANPPLRKSPASCCRDLRSRPQRTRFRLVYCCTAHCRIPAINADFMAGYRVAKYTCRRPPPPCACPAHGHDGALSCGGTQDAPAGVPIFK